LFTKHFDLNFLYTFSKNVQLISSRSGLEDLLDDLLLLNQESANNSVADTVGAAGSTIGTADGLLGLGNLSILTGTERNDLL
jgi:hypothetical protein